MKTIIDIDPERLEEIQNLIQTWNYQTKLFMRARFNQCQESASSEIVEAALSALFLQKKRKKIEQLRHISANETLQSKYDWDSFLVSVTTATDRRCFIHLLEQDLEDIFLPAAFEKKMTAICRAFVTKNIGKNKDDALPKAPLVLVTGLSGSGKTALVSKIIKKLQQTQVEIRPDLETVREEALAAYPFWYALEDIDPALADLLRRQKKEKRLLGWSKIPLGQRWQRFLEEKLDQLDPCSTALESSIFCRTIYPTEYQTSLAGEPGNYFRDAFGGRNTTAIYHLEEAHSAFRKSKSRDSGLDRHTQTLADSANILLDEIIAGTRDCLLIATTDRPETFEPTIYRRFLEKGVILDVSELWEEADNISKTIACELKTASLTAQPEELLRITTRMQEVFRQKDLRITPARIRTLVSKLITSPEDCTVEIFDNRVRVREAFEMMAKATYGDFYQAIVSKLDRTITFDDYVGNTKHLFSEAANACLEFGSEAEKGLVLTGPPGSGKTFLARAWLSAHPEVRDLTLSSTCLSSDTDPVDGPAKLLEQAYEIAKMLSPCMVFIDEAESLVPRRGNATAASDRLVNKFLSIIDGAVPLKNVFTALTTNRIDLIDTALIRSKRLRVIEVRGEFTSKNIDDLLYSKLGKLAKTVREYVDVCATPADFSTLIEKAQNLHQSEKALFPALRHLESDEEYAAFVKLHRRTLIRILEADDSVSFESLLETVRNFRIPEDWPLVEKHFEYAKSDFLEEPMRKSKTSLDVFLEKELPEKPTVGFTIGVGASDTTGMVLPISSTLVYQFSPEKVLVTGAVASSQSSEAVQMTHQSAKEAYVMVQNFLQSCFESLDVPKLLGKKLENYTIHHQLLSASYAVGGPSAGYALALSTLSVILNVPLMNDFGLTGAPWARGSSVIIGGQRQKSEAVLRFLRRMYMPPINVRELPNSFIEDMRLRQKLVLPIISMLDLVAETFVFNADSLADIEAYITLQTANASPEKQLRQRLQMNERALANIQKVAVFERSE